MSFYFMYKELNLSPNPSIYPIIDITAVVRVNDSLAANHALKKY